MEIERKVISRLEMWKNDSMRKPLILKGARQTGKTWIMKMFGERSFDNTAYFNFDEQPELAQFFATTKDVKRILQNLILVCGQPILPQKTLIIFDEIQECNDALNSLKYFCENAPEYAVICAGSLLGVSMSRGKSFPVGKVNFIDIYPLSFLEFLQASNASLYKYVDSLVVIEPIPDIFFNQLMDQFKMYLICGGMPEAASNLLSTQNTERTEQILQDILDAYTLDFSKHSENKDIPRIGHIWNSIPSQLAKENKKFVYNLVKPGARAREYEDALLWLSHAGLIQRVFRNEKPTIPLSAYDDLTAFKIYLSDVGLLRRMAKVSPSTIVLTSSVLTEFKGALAENYILQSLLVQFQVTPRYWTSGNMAEVDFLLQKENNIIPVEVKSDENVRGKSLTFYNKQYAPALRLRYSLRNLKIDDGLLNIPLFLADKTAEFIEKIM